MSEQNQTEAIQSPYKTINFKIAEQISSANSEIVEKVVDKLASIEIDRRADALLKAVNTITEAQKELKKIKPDHQTLDGNGKVVSEGYSKEKFEEKKKLEEKIMKIDGAIKKALEGDFSFILNLK